MAPLQASHQISHSIEPHRLADRVRGKLLFLIAAPALALAIRDGDRATELWIGDSHAMTVNRRVSNAMFMRAPEGQIILRAGARLMYSIAHGGFPPRVVLTARLIGRMGRPGAIVPVFCAGEIDVRVHLPARLDEPLEWVDAYVRRCLALAATMRARRAAFFVPPPPVDVPEQDVWFPINGTIAERVLAHTRLRQALQAALRGHPEAVLIDLTDDLAGPSGCMPIQLTFDGAHTNLRAVALVRSRIAQLDLPGR